MNHPQESRTEESLRQEYEAVLKKCSIDPKWDYSSAGQSVIMPVRKKRQ